MARADPAFEWIFFKRVGNAVRLREEVTAITVSCLKDPDESLLRSFAVDGCGVPGYQGKDHRQGVREAQGLWALPRKGGPRDDWISIRETGIFGSSARFETRMTEEMYRSGS
jgi:hypothetical protein